MGEVRGWCSGFLYRKSWAKSEGLWFATTAPINFPTCPGEKGVANDPNNGGSGCNNKENSWNTSHGVQIVSTPAALRFVSRTARSTSSMTASITRPIRNWGTATMGSPTIRSSCQVLPAGWDLGATRTAALILTSPRPIPLPCPIRQTGPTKFSMQDDNGYDHSTVPSAHAALAALVLAVAGCGGGASHPPVQQVRGKVLLGDAPVSGAEVSFIPKGDAGKPARGKTDDSGAVPVEDLLWSRCRRRLARFRASIR